MKKMIIALALLLTFGGYSFAQTTPAKTKKKTTTSTVAPASRATTKKDGTPDMRYKANKDAAKVKTTTVHTKKDGTADKRFKENKKK